MAAQTKRIAAVGHEPSAHPMKEKDENEDENENEDEYEDPGAPGL